MEVSTIIADRDCDNKCSFYAVREMCNPKSAEDVIEEIKSLKSSKIIFSDPNFFYPKEYSLNGCFILGMSGDTEEDLSAIPEKINYLEMIWKKLHIFKNIWFGIKNSSNKTLTEKLILLEANIGFKYLEIQGD